MKVEDLLKNKNFCEFQNLINEIKFGVSDKTLENVKKPFDYECAIYDNSDEISKSFDSNYKYYKAALIKLDALYNDYSSDYASKDEFVKNLFICLKDKLSNVFLKSDNSLPLPKEADDEYYETKREEYLDILRFHSSNDISVLLSEKLLKEKPIEEIKAFVDFIESKLLDLDKFKHIFKSSDRRNMLDYVLFGELEKSAINSGNPLITQMIKINKDKFEAGDNESKKLLQLLNTSSFFMNYINLQKSGIVDSVGFDGVRFFNLIDNSSIIKSSNKFNIANACINKQSNIVLNEDYARVLIGLPKVRKNVKGRFGVFYKEVEDNNIKVEKTLFVPSFRKTDNLGRYLVMNSKIPGVFVKEKRVNQDNGNFEIMLYYFCDGTIENGIQLMRMDKVQPTFKGQPASHKLRGGEKIFTTMHIHLYNQVDATLKNPDKESSLGAMDISLDFLNPTDLTIDMSEEFFNQMCGITNLALEKRNKDEMENLNKEEVVNLKDVDKVN